MPAGQLSGFVQSFNMVRTLEQILAPLSLHDFIDLCDRLGAPVGGVLTPISDECARKFSFLNMLGEWAREQPELPPITDE